MTAAAARSVPRLRHIAAASLAQLLACARPTPIPAEPPASAPAPSIAVGSPVATVPAELLLVAQRVVTPDGDSQANAVAVIKGRIVAVGRHEELAALGDARTRRLEFPEAVILPGLVDAHAHVAGLGDALASVDLVGTRSFAEVLERVKTAAERQPSGWILGRGWDQNDWPERVFPTNQELERVVPGRAVWLRRVDGHAGLASRAALEAAGVERTTKDPPGGRILRIARTREPSGVLVDAAMQLVVTKIPEPSLDEQRARVESALGRIASVGLTGVHDMGTSESTLAIYRELAARGKLGIRLYVALNGKSPKLAEQIAQGPRSDDFVTVRAVKFYADGALGSRGAALLADYADDRGNRGLFVTPPGELRKAVEGVVNAGFQPCVHAIGDAGNRAALDAFEAALKGRSSSQIRPRVEHAQVVAVEDIARFAGLGVIASMQPTHATSDMPWAEARVGVERLAGAYAWQRMRAAGVRLAFGSDFPVERPHVLEGLYAAVARADRNGDPAGGWFPDQRLTLGQAVDGFTRGAAYAEFADTRRGRIAVLHDADFTIVRGELEPLLEGRAGADARALLRATVEATVVGGRVVYRHAVDAGRVSLASCTMVDSVRAPVLGE